MHFVKSIQPRNVWWPVLLMGLSHTYQKRILVSDPALTKDCGFLSKLAGVSIMAVKAFNIQVGLNLPHFMENRGQLPADEVQVE